jgi:hypothetical protein
MTWAGSSIARSAPSPGRSAVAARPVWCDRERPFARIYQAGLTWLLNGAALVMVTKDASTIETQTGARQTFRRKSAEPARVLAWELAQ